MLSGIENIPPLFLIIIGVWSILWKGLALWRASKKDRVYWFMAILVLNTFGILPLFYLIYYDRKYLKGIFIKYFKKAV